jgi:hypothetical protein
MGLIWLAAGLLTAWLMYHDKEKIPVVKAILITLFGWLSLIIWGLFHLGYTINNPMTKREVKLEIVGRVKEKATDKKK